MRLPLVLLITLFGTGCATRPAGYFTAATNVTSVEKELSIFTLPSNAPSVTIVLLFPSFGTNGTIDIVHTTPGGFIVQRGHDLYLLGFSKKIVRIGGNVFGRMVELDRDGADTLRVGDLVFRKQKVPYEPIQHNEGSRPPSGDSPASGTPSAPATRG